MTVVVCNFTPVVRHDYRFGVPRPGTYVEVLNSDAEQFGGSNVLNEGAFTAEDIAMHGMDQSLSLTLPPLATIYLELKPEAEAGQALPELVQSVPARRRPAATSSKRTAGTTKKSTAPKKKASTKKSAKNA